MHLVKQEVFAVIAVAALMALPTPVAAQVVINEVYYLGASAADDWIELKNTGNSAVDVSSWWLCARFSYAQVGGLFQLDGSGFVIPAGGIITVMSWTNLNVTSSDLGLYNSTSFALPSAMLDFVQWGGAGIGREGVADDAGLWTAGDFTATAGSGQSAMWAGTNSGGGELTLGSDFVNGEPTRGAENTSVAAEAATWSRVKALFR